GLESETVEGKFGNPNINLLAGFTMVGETVDEVELAGVADDEGVVTDVEGEVGSCCVASIEVRRQLETPPEDDGNGAEMDIGDGSGAGVELWAFVQGLWYRRCWTSGAR
ncbi:hypothetical protein U1Q18_048409, partial [Sarracenia purpurea var. burkii]